MPIYIGYTNYGNPYYFDGKIAKLKIWKSVRNTTQIQESCWNNNESNFTLNTNPSINQDKDTSYLSNILSNPLPNLILYIPMIKK